MQYFTEAVRTFDFYASPEEQAALNLRWEDVCRRYRERFNALSNRLSKKVVDFYSTRNFHDFKLVDIEIMHGNVGTKNPVKVILNLSNGTEQWELMYKKVQKLELNYSGIDSYRGFDDLIYEEILDVNDKLISHEMLFASEANIVIHFENKMLTMSKR